MTLRDVDDLSVVAAGDTRRVLSSNQRRVREIVIDKLTPLHQHQRPLAALVARVAAQCHRLRHEASTGQGHVAVTHTRTVDTVAIFGRNDPLQCRVHFAPVGVHHIVARSVETAERSRRIGTRCRRWTGVLQRRDIFEVERR